MRHKILILFFCLLSLWAVAQKATRLIIRGDDMGYSHSGNEAIIQCFKDGIESSIEVIVPSPWFPEAVKMLAENPNIDVGVHLAITAEWDNIKWRPISDCPSLKDPDGYFYPMIWPNKNYPGMAVKDHPWKIEDVEKEFRAQIELALKKIPRISHISGHMGCTDFDPALTALTRKLTDEYKITIDLKAAGVKGMGYDGPHKTAEEKVKSFLSALDKLEPGGTYIFVDHPGLDSPELQAVHHIGYEDVSADRQGVTSLWTNPDVKKAIKRKNIKLIGYKDIK